MTLYDEEFHEIKTGGYVSVDVKGNLRHDAFCCSRCFRLFFVDYKNLQKMVETHVNKCSFRIGNDGIVVITKNDLNNAKTKHVIDYLGSISKNLQGIDFPMTDSDSVMRLNQTVFVYVNNGKPKGFVTVDDRNIVLKDNIEKCFKSVSDFCVFQHAQRNGVGKKMFDYMLGYYNKTPSELAYCAPSFATRQFLKKWYGIDIKTVVCW